jgi:hypothetical protein
MCPKLKNIWVSKSFNKKNAHKNYKKLTPLINKITLNPMSPRLGDNVKTLQQQTDCYQVPNIKNILI